MKINWLKTQNIRDYIVSKCIGISGLKPEVNIGGQNCVGTSSVQAEGAG